MTEGLHNRGNEDPPGPLDPETKPQRLTMRPPYRLNPEHQPNPERLPADFDSALQKTDERLSDLARLAASRTPQGLSNRVFEASVGDLPVGTERGAAVRPEARPEWRPRLAGTRRNWRVIATGWGRLGLAAALGFAFVVAGVVMDGPPAQPGGELAALDIGWLEEDPLDDVDAQVAHILDTDSLSYDDVAGELESMIASLEM